MSNVSKQTVAGVDTEDGQTLPPLSAPPLDPDDSPPDQQLATVPSDEMEATPVGTVLQDPTDTAISAIPVEDCCLASTPPIASVLQDAADTITAVPVEDCCLAPTPSVPVAIDTKRYEIMPGLWAHLSGDAVIIRHKNEYRQETELVVRSKKASLGDCFLVGENLCLRGKVQACSSASSKWDIVVSDLIISIENLALDPLVDRTQVVQFLENFGSGSPEPDAEQSNATAPSRPLPSKRLNQEEFAEFLCNVRNDVRVHADNADGKNNQSEGSEMIDQKREDFKVPSAKVRAVTCRISNDSSCSIDFPGCIGSTDCTLRVLLDYYCRSILNSMDVRSGEKAEVNAQTATADITSVGGSIVGAAAGAAVLGPVGFVAGSFLGSHLGRKHSGSIAGATAGAALFGPIGLMAGACIGESTRQLDSEHKSKSVVLDSSGGASSGGVARSASEHISSNKYEYAGSAGVVAGATAGSVLGPVGFVAGAYLGSVSARKMVETASNSMTTSREADGGNCSNEEKPYKFGDVTRGIVARGKKSRGSGGEDSYQFGDFTRGMFSGGKGK